MKKFIISLGVIAMLLAPQMAIANHEIPPTDSEEETLKFSVFTREDCGHCQDLEEFLMEDFEARVPGVQAKLYHLEEESTYELYTEFTDEYNLIKATPTILIGTKILQGFNSAETTGEYIIELASELEESSYFEDFLDGQTLEEELVIHLPFFGRINLQDYTLGFLSVVLGFVDGFNPCAMWVLIMFLTLLLQAGNKRKMFELAGIFVIAETVMYYMILNVWYKTWDFVQLDKFITPIIGLVSVGAGIFFLYEFFTNKDNECKVTSSKQKIRISTRIKEMVDTPFSIGVFFATLGLALSVNIVEFACSIGIPQAFTKILDLNDLGFLMRQVYILIYTFFYMIDDFIVFAIALYGMQYLHLTTKYTRYCLILGGTIMLVLGYFFIFDPSKLVL